MIEFAIVLPLLLLLVGGIVDFGRLFFDLNNLTNAAREGARLGAVLPHGAASRDTVEARVLARFNGNTIKNSNLTAARVFVDSLGLAPNITIQVRIQGYQLNPIFLGAILKDSITQVRAEFRHEFQ